MNINYKVLEKKERDLEDLFEEKINSKSINKNKNEYYKISYKFSDLDERFYVRGKTAKEIAQNLISKYSNTVSNEGRKLKHGKNFSEIGTEWFNTCKRKSISEGNVYNYKLYLNKYIYQAFGTKGIKDISYPELQEFLNSNCELSLSAVNYMKNILCNIFKYAYINKYINIDPTVMLKIPSHKKRDTTKSIALNDHEKKLCFEAAKMQPQMLLMISILFVYGLRPKELLFLKWKNIYFNDNIIFIETSKYTNKAICDDVTKYQRKLPMSEEISSLLKEEKKVQKRQGIYNDDGYIFHKAKSIHNELTTKEFDKYFKTLIRNMSIINGAKTFNNKIVDQSKKVRDFVPYSFRKDVATELQKTMSEQYASIFIGHCPKTLINKVYSQFEFQKHLLPQYQQYITDRNKELKYYLKESKCHKSATKMPQK